MMDWRRELIVAGLAALLATAAAGGQEKSHGSHQAALGDQREIPRKLAGAQTARFAPQNQADFAQNDSGGGSAKPPAQQPDQAMPAMPGMNMGQGGDTHAETGAMHSMQSGHHMDSAHMRMTPARPATPEDLQRADQIAAALRQSLERYVDYRIALADGYRIFAPNLPQPMYHFTNYWNGYLEGFTFDPARPTSLLYKKTKAGYELIGAMYTAPRTATLDQLNERVPLGVARWHLHTNLCMPARGQAATADWTKFGLMGSISSEESCQEAGGRFYPQVFGWMVHVYPSENSREKVWAH